MTPQYLMEHLKVYTKGTLGYKVEGLWTEVTKTESFSNTQTGGNVVSKCPGISPPRCLMAALCFGFIEATWCSGHVFCVGLKGPLFKS